MPQHQTITFSMCPLTSGNSHHNKKLARFQLRLRHYNSSKTRFVPPGISFLLYVAIANLPTYPQIHTVQEKAEVMT